LTMGGIILSFRVSVILGTEFGLGTTIL